MLFDEMKDSIHCLKIVNDPSDIKIFNIQNVADFFLNVDKKCGYSGNAIYSYFPPFPRTWFEFTCTVIKDMMEDNGIGFDHETAHLGSLITKEREDLISIWIFRKFFFSDQSYVVPAGEYKFIVDEYGRFVKAYRPYVQQIEDLVAGFGIHPLYEKLTTDIAKKTWKELPKLIGNKEDRDRLLNTDLQSKIAYISKILMPAQCLSITGLALNFLHCKNVSVEREEYGLVKFNVKKYNNLE